MTTEADQKPTLSDLANEMENSAYHYTQTAFSLAQAKISERAAFTKANNAKRAFTDAVNALKQKRPKKTPAELVAA